MTPNPVQSSSSSKVSVLGQGFGPLQDSQGWLKAQGLCQVVSTTLCNMQVEDSRELQPHALSWGTGEVTDVLPIVSEQFQRLVVEVHVGAELQILCLPNIVSLPGARVFMMRPAAIPSKWAISTLPDDLSGRPTTALGWIRLAVSFWSLPEEDLYVVVRSTICWDILPPWNVLCSESNVITCTKK